MYIPNKTCHKEMITIHYKGFIQENMSVEESSIIY